MNNLEKIINVWNNLEMEYSNYVKTKKNNISRKEYLKKLLAFRDNKPSLVEIKELIGVEQESYSKDDLESMKSFFSILEKAINYVQAHENINSLNNFIEKVIEYDLNKEYETIDIELFKNKSSSVQVVEAITNGIFRKASFLDDSGNVKFFDDSLFNNYFQFKDNSEIGKFVQQYQKKKMKTNFETMIIKALKTLISKNKITGSISFIAPDLCSINKRSVSIGNIKTILSKANTIQCDDFKLLVHSVSGKLGEQILVMFV